MTRTHPLLLGLIALLGCGDKDGTTNPDDTDTKDSEEEVLPETECTDGLDNDEDGLSDCDDSDCVAVPYCIWPTAIVETSVTTFTGNKITCKVAGFPVDVDIEDCTTVQTSDQAWVKDGDVCPQCNRTFAGAFSYPQDSCKEKYGDQVGGERATEGSFGLIFAQNKWVLFGKDGSGTWVEQQDLTPDGQGGYSYTQTESVDADLKDCNNGVQHLGDLSFTITFKEAP